MIVGCVKWDEAIMQGRAGQAIVMLGTYKNWEAVMIRVEGRKPGRSTRSDVKVNRLHRV